MHGQQNKGPLSRFANVPNLFKVLSTSLWIFERGTNAEYDKDSILSIIILLTFVEFH